MNAKIKTIAIAMLALLGLSKAVAAGTTESPKLQLITYDMTLVMREGAPPGISFVTVVEVNEGSAATWLSAREGDQISFSYTLSELDTLQLLESEGLVAYTSSGSALDAITASQAMETNVMIEVAESGVGATLDSAAGVTIVATATFYDGMGLEATTMASDIGGTATDAPGLGIDANQAMTVSAATADGVVLEVIAFAIGQEAAKLLDGAGLGTLVSDAATATKSANSAYGLTIATATWEQFSPVPAALSLETSTGDVWVRA